MKALNALKREPLAPVKTQTQLKKTRAWAKEQMR